MAVLYILNQLHDFITWWQGADDSLEHTKRHLLADGEQAWKLAVTLKSQIISCYLPDITGAFDILKGILLLGLWRHNKLNSCGWMRLGVTSSKRDAGRLINSWVPLITETAYLRENRGWINNKHSPFTISGKLVKNCGIHNVSSWLIP